MRSMSYSTFFIVLYIMGLNLKCFRFTCFSSASLEFIRKCSLKIRNAGVAELEVTRFRLEKEADFLNCELTKIVGVLSNAALAIADTKSSEHGQRA
jgi:hypothetical protein